MKGRNNLPTKQELMQILAKYDNHRNAVARYIPQRLYAASLPYVYQEPEEIKRLRTTIEQLESDELSLMSYRALWEYIPKSLSSITH